MLVGLHLTQCKVSTKSLVGLLKPLADAGGSTLA
jgi:hypothetical protein